MNLDNFREAIDECTQLKISEPDIQKKKQLEDLENRLKKELRNQEIQIKLKKLYYDKQFIGYICVASQLVEFKIREIILQLQQLAILLNKKFKLDKNWEDKPLGGLITILKTQCIEDEDLIKQLDSFNDLRIAAIHELFDTSIKIESVEYKIEQLTPTFSYYNRLIVPLERYRYAITNKTIEFQSEKGQIPKESMVVIEKLREKMGEIDPDLKNGDVAKNIKL